LSFQKKKKALAQFRAALYVDMAVEGNEFNEETDDEEEGVFHLDLFQLEIY